MENRDKVEQPIGIIPSFLFLPAPLRKQILRRFFGAVVTLAITIISLIVTKEPSGCIGFLLVVGFAYLGMDIIWEFQKGNIIVARMVVCKARKGRHGQINVILRDASITDLANQEVETCQYHITPGFRDKSSITTGTVLNIYISQKNPQALLAYEILGEI